jgi:hypothetical protein
MKLKWVNVLKIFSYIRKLSMTGTQHKTAMFLSSGNHSYAGGIYQDGQPKGREVLWNANPNMDLVFRARPSAREVTTIPLHILKAAGSKLVPKKGYTGTFPWSSSTLESKYQNITENTAVGIRHADHVAPSIRKSCQSLRRQAAVARPV